MATLSALTLTAGALSMFAKDVVNLTAPAIQGFPGDTTTAWHIRTRTRPALDAGLFFEAPAFGASMFSGDAYVLGADMPPGGAASALVGVLDDAEAIAVDTEAGVDVSPERARALATKFVALAPYGRDFPAIDQLKRLINA